jgi:outer membrane protein OmpA-like peptidoglycan-associated protein
MTIGHTSLSKAFFLALFFISLSYLCIAQSPDTTSSIKENDPSYFDLDSIAQKKLDSIRMAKNMLKSSRVTSDQKEIKLTIRNFDISSYPNVKVIVEAFNMRGEPLDTLYADNLTVLENGVEKKVLSVNKISPSERVPIDFVFVVDITASMETYIKALEQKVRTFTNELGKRGIDYQLGLVLFSDYSEGLHQLTDDVTEFIGWLRRIRTVGGGDIPENALGALERANDDINYRPSANRVAVLITDAPFHDAMERRNPFTNLTADELTRRMIENEMRVFGIVPSKLRKYELMSSETRGTTYDMNFPFKNILNSFSDQLTNLYALEYRTLKPAIPDSINIALINEKKQKLTEKTIPIVELGRKLIIKNLLYQTGKSTLPDTVKELEVLTQFMKNKPNVTIQIEGHTDSMGPNWINDKLSKERAEGVKDYLVRNSIDGKRISTVGYGERRPLVSNKTEFGRAANRRTEIIITGK